jgi:hypothetical protein
MFLNYIKEFFAKKNVKSSLSNVKLTSNDIKIKTIGVVFDESYFHDKEKLILELVNQGISKTNISMLVFKNKINKKEVFEYPVYSYRDLSWYGSVEKGEVKSFVNQPFDLLISYYDTERAALLLISQLSKASFKVGFSSVDHRLNHFMIDTNTDNYKVFIEELFKYLRILNKI